MRKLITLLGCFFMVVQFAFAQGRTITGKVTDATGDNVPNASILIKGTSTGTTSKADGSFSISVPANAKTLVFSAVGMASKEFAIGNNQIINASLELSDKNLDEVVVVGYTVQKKKDVAAAISKISGDEIKNLPMPTVAQAMQGRAAGVAVSANNGIPGGSINVRIRGIGSITAGNNPLFVVDGIQMNTASTATVASSTISTGKTQNNPLSFLNTADVESIEILKDAAAAAIYGAKAANGVVLITTKRGTTGKAKYNVNSYYGQVSPMRTQAPINNIEFLQSRSEAIVNGSGGVTTMASARATVLSEMGLATTLTDKEVEALPVTDWVKETWGTGVVKNMEMSMQAGNATTSVYMSGSYSHQEAIIKPTDFTRGTYMLKASHKASKKLTFESQINLSSFSQKANFGQNGGGNSTLNAAYTATQILSINPVRRPDGQFFGLAGSGDNWVGGFANNIAAAQQLFKSNTRTNQVVGSLSSTYNITPDLSIKSLAGLDYRLSQIKAYYDPRLVGAQYNGVSGTGEIASNWNTNFITNTVLSYKKSLKGGHNISGMVGVEYRNDIAEATSAQANTFPSYDFQNLNSAATPVAIGESWTGYTTWSQFGRLGYNFNSKYIVGFTLRRDGSSRFGSNNLYGIFPSVQFAWNARDENFFSRIDNLSELKFRYSYGESGNDQIGNFDSRQLYGSSRVYNNGSAINPTQLGNPDLSWETRTEHNAGFDLGLFNNRVGLTFDAYRRVNVNLLLDRNLYSTTGFSGITQNSGSVLNKGLEFLLRVTPIDGAFKWTSSFNITFTENKILKLYDTVKVMPGSPEIRVGQWLGSHFTSRWAGVNPADGRSMWYDINGNITYNPTAADRVFIGNIHPKTFGGWNNNFSYKGFEIDAFFQYEYGRIRFDNQLQQEARVGFSGTSTIKQFWDNRWTSPGQITHVPRASSATTDMGAASWNTGSRFYFKNDYIRLKQVTASYVVSSSLLKRAKISSARFYVQGINLWTLTKFPGADPEYTDNSSTIIPQSKNVTVGVSFQF